VFFSVTQSRKNPRYRQMDRQRKRDKENSSFSSKKELIFGFIIYFSLEFLGIEQKDKIS
jgi:hypothetical protein